MFHNLLKCIESRLFRSLFKYSEKKCIINKYTAIKNTLLIGKKLSNLNIHINYGNLYINILKLLCIIIKVLKFTYHNLVESTPRLHQRVIARTDCILLIITQHWRAPLSCKYMSNPSATSSWKVQCYEIKKIDSYDTLLVNINVSKLQT